MCAGVNPFNLTTHLSLAQLRQQWYNCAGRVYSTSDGSDGRAVDVAMICFSLSSQDCENLARHSTRFIQIFQLDHVGGFQDREITMYEGDYTFDIGLARHLITLNAQDVIDLPDCANISLLQFVEICETFGFEQMLDAMAEYCLRVGIHFLPDFFEALIHTYGLLHNRVTHLWMVFTAWWNRSQLTLLHQYFHEHHAYDDLSTGDLRLGDVLAENSDLLPGMIRSLLQSPAVRLDPQFWLNPRIHVCPQCELPIPQNGELEAENLAFTSCCSTAVHTQCFVPGTLSCEVCSHENCNVRIPVFFDGSEKVSNMTIRDMLLDRQGHRWSLCQRHEDCYVYQRADWSTMHHCSRIRYEAAQSSSQSDFAEFMQIAYIREYYSRTHRYWPVGSGRVEYLDF